MPEGGASPRRETVTGESTDRHGPRAPGDDEALARGLMLGRYVILDRLGAGGMGVVYAAFDPELDRRVALKLLRVDHRGDAAARRERLLREAKALARLSHPNVVAVHDVGSFRDQVFVAMEYVDGQTVRAWLEARPRPWREVLKVFVAAGRGLAAAHSAGLVHQDFKPDNVLIDAAGRVRVTDFGLAEVRAGAPAAGAATPSRGRVGTRGYMAPEQLAGGPTDARSDQFSFCVSLAQALGLGGEGGPGAVPGPAVPGWVRRVVLRGQAAAPSDRHPTTDALLEALERDPARARLRVGALAAAVLVTGAAAAAAWQSATAVERECRALGAEVEAFFGAEVRERLKGAFLGGHLRADAWRRLEPRLDAHARQLSVARADACLAARVRTAAPDDAHAARRACLERRIIELEALTQLLLEGDPEVLVRAEEASQAVLTPLRRCEGMLEAAVRAAPDATAAAVPAGQARSRLAEARVLRVAGQYRRGRELAQAVADEAARASDRALQAEALLTLAALEVEAQDYSGAEQTLREALYAAEAAAEPEVRAAVWIELVGVLGYRLERPEEAFLAERHARALLERMGPTDQLRADLENNLGRVLQQQGRHLEALEHFEEALSLRRRYHGEVHLVVAASLNNLGLVLSHLGRTGEALGHYREAMAVVQTVLGPEHPEMAVLHQNLGGTWYRAGRLQDAREAFGQALALNERALGPSHARVATSASNLSMTLARQGEVAEAIGLERRALEIRERAPGNELDVARSQADLAVLLLREGRLEEAEALAGRSLLTRERLLGPQSPLVAASLTYLGRVHLARGRPALAREEHARALDILERTLGPNRVELAEDLAGIGLTHLAEGHPQRAVPSLERAEALRTVGGEGPLFSTVSFELARALWAAGGDRRRACELARSAREELAYGMNGGGGSVSSVDGFLARCHEPGARR